MRYATKSAGTAVWDTERERIVATCTDEADAAEIVAALNGLEQLDVVVTALEDAAGLDSQSGAVRGAVNQVVGTAITVVERWRVKSA